MARNLPSAAQDLTRERTAMTDTNSAKDELGLKIKAIKKKKKLTWKQIAEAVGMSPVWTTAALLGQMSMEPQHAEKAAKFLGLSPEEAELLCEIPYRGSLPTAVPTDPLI